MNSSSSQNLHQSLTHNLYIKSHKKYKEIIEHKYNQIWHEIKANKNLVVNYNFFFLVIVKETEKLNEKPLHDSPSRNWSTNE